MATSQENKLQLALIGYGYWGKKIYQTLSASLEHNYPITVIDPALNMIPSDNHLNIASFNSILNNPDISHVVIATPEETHFSLAKQCLEHKKHVFVEKPLCLSEKDAKILTEIATKNKLKLFVDYTFLFDPYITNIKQLLDQNKIGKLIKIESTRHSINIHKPNISVFDDLATHDIYLGEYLFESLPLNCETSDKKKNNNQIVEATALYSFHQGILIAHYSWIQPVTKRILKIIGTQGEITWDKENSFLILKQKSNRNIRIHVQASKSPLELSLDSFINNKQKSKNHIPHVKILEKLRNFQ